MRIVVLGHVCIDINTSEHSSYTAAGSPAMFMHKIFSQFPGVKDVIVAPHGRDFSAYRGTAVLYPPSPVGLHTLTYKNVTQSLVRHQTAFHLSRSAPVPFNRRMGELLTAADIVFVAPLTPGFSPSYLRESLSYCRPHTLKVLLPQGYFRAFDRRHLVVFQEFPRQDRILSLFDLVVLSAEDHPDMLKLAGVWAKKHSLIVVVTLGDRGAVAFHSQGKISLSTRPVPLSRIVDSVGSGDIFSAGFAYRFRQTRDIRVSGAFANRLARQCLYFTPDKIRIDLKKLGLGR